MSHTAIQPETAAAPGLPSFGRTLYDNGLKLARETTATLQINVGFLCNQQCRHCHLEAGPARDEIMSEKTMRQVIDFAARGRFETADITGGAPELNPNLEKLIAGLSPIVSRVILRSNLTAASGGRWEELIAVCKDHGVAIVASLPSLNRTQADAQRGDGVHEKSLQSMRRLNEAGYGREGSGLELSLVANPAGAFLPQPQEKMEARYRADMKRKWDLEFTSLYTFANVPLGRFRDWLVGSGNYGAYMRKLADSFNPCAIQGLMCRSLVSVAWDGYLYDCDFNLAMGLALGGKKTHVTEMKGPPPPGSPIAVSDHCYTCTAGSGFT